MITLATPSPTSLPFRNDASTLMQWLRNSCLFAPPLPYSLQGTGIASIDCLAPIHPPPSPVETWPTVLYMLKRPRHVQLAVMLHLG
jgi:hypothetical protein